MQQMKNSNIPWIGEIPQDWEVGRLKNVIKIGSNADTSMLSEKDTVTFLPMQFIKNGYFIPNEDEYKKCNSSYTLFTENEILLAKVTPCFENGNIAITKELKNKIGFGSSEIFAVSCKKNTNINYIFYFLQNPFFVSRATESMTGAGGLKRVSAEFINTYPLGIPPLKTQQKIADFLDSKCSKIDSTIEQEKQHIEKLKEYRQSFITEAVTKGLDKNAPMKDSGIEWIGEIPNDWETCKNKFLSVMKSGSTITSEQIHENGEYPVYGGNGLRGYCSAFTNSGTHILIGRQGALCGNVRLAQDKFWASEHAIVVYPFKNVFFKYYYYILLSANLNQYSTSAAQPGLAVEQIANLRFCIPPLDEQKQIADYLDKKIAQIDNAIAKKETLISKLQEYKKSLIFEAVTGKMEI